MSYKNLVFDALTVLKLIRTSGEGSTIIQNKGKEMVEYRINKECPHCKQKGILDYNPIGTNGVHYAWIDCRLCKRRWREEDHEWEELIKYKIPMQR